MPTIEEWQLFIAPDSPLLVPSPSQDHADLVRAVGRQLDVAFMVDQVAQSSIGDPTLANTVGGGGFDSWLALVPRFEAAAAALIEAAPQRDIAVTRAAVEKLSNLLDWLVPVVNPGAALLAALDDPANAAAAAIEAGLPDPLAPAKQLAQKARDAWDDAVDDIERLSKSVLRVQGGFAVLGVVALIAWAMMAKR